MRAGEEAIHRGLKKRLEQLADERERRERAAAAADEEFSAGFLNAARDVFIMMDKDDSGTLTKEEILHAVKNEDEVQKFLISCGNQNLSDLMVPSKLEKTLAELDTDKSGEVDLPEWEAAIAQALANKLEQRAKDRAEAAAKARAENEAFTKEFLNKAREVFELIDKDDSGSLAIDEITTAVKSDKVVKDFLKTCGDETLMFLLQPKRLDHALRELDTDGSGEVDIDECTARRPTCHPIDATPARRTQLTG